MVRGNQRWQDVNLLIPQQNQSDSIKMSSPIIRAGSTRGSAIISAASQRTAADLSNWPPAALRPPPPPPHPPHLPKVPPLRTSFICVSVSATAQRTTEEPKMGTFLFREQPPQKKNTSGTIDLRRQVCMPTSVLVAALPSQCASSTVRRGHSSLARCLFIPSSSLPLTPPIHLLLVRPPYVTALGCRRCSAMGDDKHRDLVLKHTEPNKEGEKSFSGRAK